VWYPIVLRTVDDIKKLRIALMSAQGGVGRASDTTKGAGNPTKRIRLVLSFSSPVELVEVAVTLEGKAEPRSYWAFCANPDTYRVEAAVEDLVVDHWTTKGKPVKVGDRALIWKALGRGRNRGIVALAEITSAPVVTSDDENPFWIDRASSTQPEERVAVRYVKPSGAPLWLSESNKSVLGSLSVSRGQGTVFYVTQNQFDDVVRLAGGWPEDIVEPESTSRLLVRNSTPSVVQGRLADTEARRAIELYAMERAIAYFSNQWHVQDVSRIACFDLLCRTAAAELRVEVKGTVGAGEAVLITKAELENARRHFPHVALFVTSGISLDRTQSPPRVSGGTDRVLHPWDVTACRLAPVTLECWLP
jgi:hypothetical protein